MIRINRVRGSANTLPLPITLQPINREGKDDSYMSKFLLLEQTIREVKDTGDELIETETLDIETELLKWDLKETIE